MNQEEIERNIAFIVEQQANFFADIEALKAATKVAEEQARERGKQIDARLDRIGRRLDRAVRLGVQAVRQEREKRRQMDEEWTAKLNILIDAQMRSEEETARLRQATVEAQSQAATQHAQAQVEMKQLRDIVGTLAQVVKVANGRLDALEQAN